MANSDKVVIFGGTGFIGSSLVGLLKGKVSSLKVVSRGASGFSGSGVEYVKGDVSDKASVEKVIEGATVVYQLTVESDFDAGARNMAEACLRHNVRRLIYASTSDTLYLGKRGTILETDGPDPQPELRNDYSRGKGLAERLLLRYHAEQGLNAVIMRPCLVVGQGGHLSHGGIGTWASPTCCLGWGSGHNPMPFVLVRDVAQAMYLALDTAGIEGKAFNLGGDVFLSAREYVDLLAQHTYRNFRFRPRNTLLFYAQVSIRKFLKQLFGGGQGDVQSYRDIKSSQMLTQIDNSQSKELLGWKPNDNLETFVKEAIESHLDPLLPGDLRLEKKTCCAHKKCS